MGKRLALTVVLLATACVPAVQSGGDAGVAGDAPPMRDTSDAPLLPVCVTVDGADEPRCPPGYTPACEGERWRIILGDVCDYGPFARCRSGVARCDTSAAACLQDDPVLMCP